MMTATEIHKWLSRLRRKNKQNPNSHTRAQIRVLKEVLGVPSRKNPAQRAHEKAVKASQKRIHWARKGKCSNCGGKRTKRRFKTCDACREDSRLRSRKHRELR